MNAPHFNTNNLPDSFGSVTWMKAIETEEHRCCDGIDARRRKLNEEYVNLCQKHGELSRASARAGLFARIGLHFKMKSIDREMSWRRDVMDELIDARIARTYGGK